VPHNLHVKLFEEGTFAPKPGGDEPKAGPPEPEKRQ